MTEQSRPGESGTGDDDERRWAEALARLAQQSDEPTHRRVARARYDRRAGVVAVWLVGAVLAIALLSLALDPPPERAGGPPTWRVVTGLSVVAVGLAFAIVAPLARPYGSRTWIGRPLQMLSRDQQKRLVAEVRGRAAVVPGRLPLARLSAETLLERRSLMLVQAGFAVAFLGLWITGPSPTGTILAVGWVTALAGSAWRVHRDGRLVRRFLDEHPTSAGGAR